MSEPSKTLIFLRQQISTSDEVVGALKRSRSRPTLNEKGRDEIRKVLLRLRDTEMKIAESNESFAIRQLRTIIEDLELISNMADANNVYYFIIQVMKHQQLNAEVEALRDEVKAEEGRIQECARRLTRAGEVLVGPLKAAKQLLEAGRKAEQAAVDVNEVVNYSQRISGITSAPAWWGPGQRMINFAPPCPRPEQMRAGALSSLSVTTRKSLTSSELLRLARDLDEKLDHGGAGENRDSGQDEDSMGKGDASSDESPGSLHGGKRKHQSGEGEKAPKRDRDGNRSTGQGKQGAGSSKAGRAGSSATGFARDAPVERPKISLDLDDLSDEGSDEGSDEESD